MKILVFLAALSLTACSFDTPSTSKPASSQPSPSPATQLEHPTALKGLATAGLPDKIEIEYSEGSLALSNPKEKYTLSYQPAQKQYQVTGQRQSVSSNQEPVKSEEVSFTLAEDLVGAVVKVLEPTGWRSAKEPAVHNFYTDFYPSYSLSFTLAPNQAIRLFSNSQGTTATPWNLTIGSSLYNADDQTLGTAAAKLFGQLRAANQSN